MLASFYCLNYVIGRSQSFALFKICINSGSTRNRFGHEFHERLWCILVMCSRTSGGKKMKYNLCGMHVLCDNSGHALSSGMIYM